MKSFLAAAVAAFALAGCVPGDSTSNIGTKLASTMYGQLFCQLTTSAGGQQVVGVIDAQAAKSGAAVVLAENATKAFVLAACAAAATSAGAASGVPVSPPAMPVANVAIVRPAT